MTMLAYCANGVVVATHDSSQNIPASAYGANVSVVPIKSMSHLSRHGDAPAKGKRDHRRYAAPVLTEAGDLKAYAAIKHKMLVDGGVSVNVGTAQAPIFVKVKTDTQNLVHLMAMAMMAQGTPNGSYSWVDGQGDSLALTSAQVVVLFAGLFTFVQGATATFAAVNKAIDAKTIATQAQVDTPPSPIPAWPVNS